MSFKHRPFRRVEGYSVSCLGCFQCVILSTIKKRMNQLLLPRDYSAILELIIVFTALIFLTGNVLAFVENCSHCIVSFCIACANSGKILAWVAKISPSFFFSVLLISFLKRSYFA